MTGRQIILLVASTISSSGLSGIVVALIAWRRFGPRTKAETAKIAAETRETEVGTDSQIIKNLREELARLSSKVDAMEQTINAQGEQIVALQHRNTTISATMRAAVSELLIWIKKALAVMSPDQQARVGQPPDYQHLVTPPENV